MKEHLNAIILAVAILLAVTIYCLFPWKNGRYRFVKTTDEKVTYEIDTRTGDVWVLWLADKGPKKRKFEEILPFNPLDYSLEKPEPKPKDKP